MKRILAGAAIVILSSCSKSESPKTPNPTASYTGWYSSDPINMVYGFDTHGSLTCSYYPSLNSPQPGKFNGPSYSFNFGEVVSAVQYSVSFIIPADSLNGNNFAINQTVNYIYNSASYYNMRSACNMTFSYNTAFVGSDSALLSVTISRFSNNTVDGTFSMKIYPNGFGYAEVTNGLFANIAIKRY